MREELERYPYRAVTPVERIMLLLLLLILLHAWPYHDISIPDQVAVDRSWVILNNTVRCFRLYVVS